MQEQNQVLAIIFQPVCYEGDIPTIEYKNWCVSVTLNVTVLKPWHLFLLFIQR